MIRFPGSRFFFLIFETSLVGSVLTGSSAFRWHFAIALPSRRNILHHYRKQGIGQNHPPYCLLS